jgi:hypothetical protein
MKIRLKNRRQVNLKRLHQPNRERLGPVKQKPKKGPNFRKPRKKK